MSCLSSTPGLVLKGGTCVALFSLRWKGHHYSVCGTGLLAAYREDPFILGIRMGFFQKQSRSCKTEAGNNITARTNMRNTSSKHFVRTGRSGVDSRFHNRWQDVGHRCRLMMWLRASLINSQPHGWRRRSWLCLDHCALRARSGVTGPGLIFAQGAIRLWRIFAVPRRREISRQSCGGLGHRGRLFGGSSVSRRLGREKNLVFPFHELQCRGRVGEE